MLWQLYLRNGTVYVPTVAQTEAGFYMDIEPVNVVSANDSEALQRAIMEAMSRGNPIIPTPTRAASPKPTVLKYSKAKSWSAFEKQASNWTIVEKACNYQINRAEGVPIEDGKTIPRKLSLCRLVPRLTRSLNESLL